MKARKDKAVTHLRKIEVVIRITPDGATSRSVDQLIDELSELESFYGLLNDAITKYMGELDDRVAGDFEQSVDHFEVRRGDDDDDEPDEDDGGDPGDETDEEDDEAERRIHLLRERTAA